MKAMWRKSLTAGAVMLSAGLAASGARAVTAPAVFAQCSVCHGTIKGAPGIGPSLAGVVGRAPGSVAGFAYSPAMKAKGGAWNAATLDAFLATPQKAVPGNRMPYAGQPDAAKRAAIVAYLKTLK